MQRRPAGSPCNPRCWWPLVAVAAALVLSGSAEAKPKASLKTQLKAALQRQRPSLDRCYDRELKREHPATGTVMIAMVVTRSGKVARAKIAHATPSQERVGACLAKKLTRMKLPKQRARVAVLVPIRLRVHQG